MTSILSLTVSAAHEAFGLFFEPLVALFGERNAPTVRKPLERKPLLETLRQDQVLDQELPELHEREIAQLVVDRDVVITGAAHPLAVKFMVKLATFEPARLCLLDTPEHQVSAERSWQTFIRSHANINATFAFGDLADEEWLSAILGPATREKVIVDFSSHVYVKAPLAPLANWVVASKRYAHFAEQGQISWNVLHASRSRGVTSVFLVFPRFGRRRVIERIERLYSVVRDDATIVGGHSAADQPSIVVWQPKPD